VLLAAARYSVGGVMITGTPAGSERVPNTDTLRVVRAFRFELFFLADTSICIAESTSNADNPMINVRAGLTIFRFSLSCPSQFKHSVLACFEVMFPCLRKTLNARDADLLLQ
jgi:hypothetical protein